MRPLFMAAVILAILACSCQRGEQTREQLEPQSLAAVKAAESGWVLLDTNGFSIALPAGWDINLSGAMGTTFIAIAAPDTASPDFRSNINYIRQDISQYPLNLDEYTRLSLEQIKTYSPGCEIISITEHEDYHELVYSAFQDLHEVTTYQRYSIREQTAHILTATMSSVVFERLQPTARDCFNTFGLTEKQ